MTLTGSGLDHFNTLRVPYGTVVIVTDVPTYELDGTEHRTARADRFTLEASDGSYNRTLVVTDDDVGEDDWVDLRFENLPTRATYTLKAKLEGEQDVVLFENVPYAELARQSDDLEESIGYPSEFGEL